MPEYKSIGGEWVPLHHEGVKGHVPVKEPEKKPEPKVEVKVEEVKPVVANKPRMARVRKPSN